MPARMHKRRTILIMGLLAAVAALLLLLGHPWSTGGKGSQALALKDTAKVDRILVEDVYDSTVLVRVDGSWMLFGEEACNQTAVENLLIAASRLRVSSVTRLEGDGGPEGDWNGTGRITWFNGNRTLLSFEFRYDSDSYLAIPPRSDKAYYLEVAGYPDLKLQKVFSSASSHYREHLLIDLLPSEISRIDIRLQSGEAFYFEQDPAGNIQVDAEGLRGPDSEEEVNELAIRLLFSYFTSIRYESRSGIASDSLSVAGTDGRPMATLGVHSFGGEQHSLMIYPYRPSPGAEPDLFRALVIYNQEPEALFVNYIYLDVLMRGLSHYLREK